MFNENLKVSGNVFSYKNHALAKSNLKLVKKCVCEAFFLGAWRLSTSQEHKHSLRGAVGKVGIAGPAGARTCYRQYREASRWFFTSAALCAKTWVLPKELGGSWCHRRPLAGP